MIIFVTLFLTSIVNKADVYSRFKKNSLIKDISIKQMSEIRSFKKFDYIDDKIESKNRS